tara:strand:+ start:2354 stop:2836 length:483 start_codon:yes stop_codon:yes gene_type:complete
MYKSVGMETEASDTVDNFAERFGLIAQAQGLSRIAGRIMGLIIIEGGPISFGELSKRLKVSRGSISINTRLLESFGVIERVSRSGERQDYFQIAPTPYKRLLRVQSEQLAKAQSVIRQTLGELPSNNGESRARLNDLDAFYEALRLSYDNLIEQFSNPGN